MCVSVCVFCHHTVVMNEVSYESEPGGHRPSSERLQNVIEITSAATGGFGTEVLSAHCNTPLGFHHTATPHILP